MRPLRECVDGDNLTARVVCPKAVLCTTEHAVEIRRRRKVVLLQIEPIHIPRLPDLRAEIGEYGTCLLFLYRNAFAHDGDFLRQCHDVGLFIRGKEGVERE